MPETLLKKLKCFLTGIFLLCIVSSGWTQDFKDGIRQGMVKVKFTSAMSPEVSSMNVNARKSGLTTGIQSFDAVAKATKAYNMYRLFPYDAQHESKLRKHGLHLWYVVEIDDNVDPRAAAQQFKQLKEVAIAEVDREKIIAPYTVTPYTPTAGTLETMPFNDPLLKDQWHYNNTGQSGFADADINLFPAWTKSTGNSSIVVSVHDQGVDVNHEDLKANIWTNMAELNGLPDVDDDGNGYIDDVHGYNFEKNKGAIDPQYHATHVAGTIAAVNNNGIGVSGVAGGNGSGNGVKIMSLQILGGAPIEKSYVYAANNGAVISQNSWGYTTYGYSDQSVLDAIDYFIEEAGDFPGSPMKGGIVIFAAGNSSSDGLWYPGYYEHTMAVASIGPEWKIASYSNFGDWVEISAPGGDQNYNGKSGVLSTVPKNQYAYIQGTSMACPHVSGIAALALANSTTQLTPQQLWNKLVTGVVDIDQYNPDYIGKLGSGAIDASLAISNDQHIAPLAVNDLNVTGIAQEFATLSWTVPTDTDDNAPTNFTLYYNTQPVTSETLAAASQVIIENKKAAGEEFTYELQNLLGLTNYYFAVTATDRWGNTSALSNVVSKQTNAGPAISVDEDSQTISLSVDAASATQATHDITIINGADGVLRWDHFMRHSNTSLSFNAAGIVYPANSKKNSNGINVARRNVNEIPKLRSNEPAPMEFISTEITYSDYPTNIIGETDTTLNNSAAARFYVSQAEGFNLTDARLYLKHDPAKGPVVLEVYKGTTPEKKNLIYAQNFSNWSSDETWAYITLDEQLYFEQNETFWLVFHVPHGNLFPLGIGFESDPAYSANCYMSFNLGATWSPLEEILNAKDFAWAVSAASYNAYLGEYLTLEPGSGDVDGNGQASATLTADASALINGSYNANLVLSSNDAQTRELRIPVSLTVSGHAPNIRHIDIADFGSVFVGTTKTLELELDNQGFGNFNDPVFSLAGSQFEIDGYAPWQIKAREKASVRIKFHPTAAGNINDVLTITNGTQTYTIPLFGVGAETSKIALSPVTQVKNNVAIGDEVNAQITVTNNGAFPLKYFIPGHDVNGVSENWPVAYHTYGYSLRTNESAGNPIDYEFQDISGSGTDITDYLSQSRNWYWEVDMGFEFPYYKQKMSKLYIAKMGFTTFDNSVNPINTPRVHDVYGPQGYISLLGTYLDFQSQGKIYYQVEADRVIVQYSNVWDGYNVGQSITAQMVLYADGNIRFYYDSGLNEQISLYLSVLIDDMDREDGILINNYETQFPIHDHLAIGLDYPGPDIITNVVNGSGILAPGSSSVVDLSLNTSTLVEGTINRYVNFISNDPSNGQTNALIQLDITEGGISQPVVSVDTIKFGDVFQGAMVARPFTIKNPGSANVDITSMDFTNGSFTITGDLPSTIKPGLYKNYAVVIPTATNATLEDWLTINYSDGTTFVIYITGNVVDAPAIAVDLSLLQKSLNYGETSSEPLTIGNTGLADLEVVVTGKNWMTFDIPVEPAGVLPDFTYAYEKHNDGQFYQWIDIRKTGTQMPFAEDPFDKDQYWKDLTLPFPISFYGDSYSAIKIGENGIITLEEENPEVMIFTDYIPTDVYPGKYIMPFWTFGGFDTFTFPKEDVGIFYQFSDDRIIITWSYLVNFFGGMGDPVSAQVIFYKNGTMKFQYKVEEYGSDLTSKSTVIGVQYDSSTGVSISEYASLEHGNGLTYILAPSQKHIVHPGETLSGNINFDARNVYGGVYTEPLIIQTNVPGSENLEKPVELTVVGEANLVMADTVDFGNKMIAYEYGSPVMNTIDLSFSNTGSAPLDITWAQMADANQGLSLLLLADGWFGPEWTDISNIYSPWAWETPVYTIMPGDKLDVKATFSPSATGEFTDELVLTTSSGEKRMVMTGNAFDPPALEVETTSVQVVMNTMDETADRSIAFNNLNGNSDLEYSISIDYGRISTEVSGEQLLDEPDYNIISSSGKITNEISSARAMGTYNRVLTHTDKETPDTFIGTGGAGPFTLATRYNGTAEGFNLTHVEMWFRTETVTTGRVLVEVRAGGTSIANAVKLAEGSLEFETSGDDENGKWYTTELDHPAAVYPNEDFYVIITYPLGIDYPVGSVEDQETVPGRYYYMDEGLWYDMQEVSSFEHIGWLMLAGEEVAGNSAWLSVTSSDNGTLAAGETGSVNLNISGINATRGDQIANVILHSNDPEHEEVKVPVTLHMNEAPHFEGVPETLFIGENETKTLVIAVSDTEDQAIALEALSIQPFVTHTFSDGVLTITIKPSFGEAGLYHYTFKATDEYDASEEMVLNIDVAHTNQAPAFVGDDGPLEYFTKGKLVEYSIGEFFSDPDGDAITFQVKSANPQVADVFVSESGFFVKPGTVGETELAFVVTDSHNAVTYDTITAVVQIVLGVDEELNNGLSVYPNPVDNIANISVDGDWAGEINFEIVDAVGRRYLEKTQMAGSQHDVKLNVSALKQGMYILRATARNKQASIKIIKK